jgi:HEAT repeat protein
VLFGSDATDARDEERIRQFIALPTADLIAKYKVATGDWRLERALQSAQHAKKALELLGAEYHAKETPPAARAKAVQMLGDLFLDEGQIILIEAASDSSAQVRIAAISRLTRNPTVAAATKAVRATLNDPNPYVIYYALLNLENRADVAAADRLIEIVRKPPAPTPEHKRDANEIDYSPFTAEDLRAPALRALQLIGDRRLVFVLMELLQKGSKAERSVAVTDLTSNAQLIAEEQRKPICDSLVESLTSTDPKERESAAPLMVMLGDKRGSGVLMANLRRSFHPSLVDTLAKLTNQRWEVPKRADDDPPLDRDEQKKIEERLTQSIETYLKANGYAVDPPPRPQHKLTDDERSMLEGLFREGLFDPVATKAEYTRVTLRWPEFWNSKEEHEGIVGWLTRLPDGTPDKIVFESGVERPAPKEKEKYEAFPFMDYVNFVLDAAAKNDGELPDEYPFTYMNVMPHEHIRWAYWTAWLLKLGEKEKAERLFALAYLNDDSRKTLANRLHYELMWQSMFTATMAWRHQDHAAAEQAVKRSVALLEHVTDDGIEYGGVQEYTAPDIRALAADIERRKREGTFGKPAAPIDDSILKLPAEQKIARLIAELENIAVPAGKDMYFYDWDNDPRIMALGAEGDAAIPALIDCIEKDKRLTRFCKFGFGEGDMWWKFVPVKDAAWTAVSMTLGGVYFDPVHPETDRREDDDARIRAFWNEYGSLPLAHRMMKILTDQRVHVESAHRAAYRLAHLGETEAYDRYYWKLHSARAGTTILPEVAALNHPTVGEALLKLLDRALAEIDNTRESMRIKNMLYSFERNRDRLEDEMCSALIDLHDGRLIPELKHRCATAATVRMRIKCAFVLNDLGEKTELDAFAKEFAAGTLAFDRDPDNPSSEDDDLPRFIRCLSIAHSAEADKALFAAVERGHPYFERLAGFLRKARVGWTEGEQLLAHPYCLKFFRNELDRVEGTKSVYRISAKSLYFLTDGTWAFGSSRKEIPKLLADPAMRRELAEGRACDEAAMKLPEFFFGLDCPQYHPLLKDADEKLVALRAFLDKNLPHLRALTETETGALERGSRSLFVPDIPPLGRPASNADVAAGRAIFSLGDGAKLADLQLPATAIFKKDAETDYAQRVLIVQAEVGRDGKTRYGIIEQRGCRSVDAEVMADVKHVE